MYNELIGEDDASTPLTLEEMEDLKLSYITTRDELNEAEQRNITKAFQWSERSRQDILSESFLKLLHKKMFGEVWKWAGKYRRTARNIGVDAYRIPMDINALIEDTKFWIENNTYDPCEIGARFHHKLVYIHPFPNGNGRCSRLITDLLVKQLFDISFSWGKRYVDPHERRKIYVSALRKADHHDFEDLLKFVDS